jgi:CRISPR-associated exonuclease Cas4
MSLVSLFPILGGGFLLGALILLWLSRRRRAETGVPSGRIIYSDTRVWQSVEQPLFDPALRLAGKPDYLVKSARGILPVEVKSSHVNEAPYDSHVYQLMAYCRLVETTYQARPPYGILKYPQKTFAIDYTQELEQALTVLITQIRRDLNAMEKSDKEIARSHDSAARCKGCGYRGICSQSLG